MLKGQLSTHNDWSSRVSRCFSPHDRASVTWPVPCDRWLTWPQTDIYIILQLCQPCPSCAKAVRASHSSDFPTLSFPAPLPQLAPYASHMEKCHSPLALHAAAKLPVLFLFLPPFPSLSLSFFPISFFLSLFCCLCPSIGIISYMAIKGKMLVLKT